MDKFRQSRMDKMIGAHRQLRNQHGSLLEIGPVLWFLLLCLTFPLLDFGTVALRYTFLLGACRDAAQVASMSKSYMADLTATDISAVNAAQARATLNCSQFAGVKLISVQTDLLITNLATGVMLRQSLPVAGVPDTANNLYQIEVICTGDVSPLLTYRGALMGNIPGLTGPARFAVTTQQVCENPNGMNQ